MKDNRVHHIIRHVDELGFTVSGEVRTDRVVFKVYEVKEGVNDGKSGEGIRTYAHKDSRRDFSLTIENAMVWLSGDVRSDGTSNWWFNDDNGQGLHACCFAELVKFSEIMMFCWKFTSEVLEGFDGE